jgi:hypothetical protein
LWLRRHSTSGRNPRPSSLPKTTLSSFVGSVVALRHSSRSAELPTVRPHGDEINAHLLAFLRES